jgi:flagellar protein FliT
MSCSEVITMYETISMLTNQMAAAARSSDWDRLTCLERQCASASGPACDGKIAPLALGNTAARLRKYDLLKQIMANDREIRNNTEPWIRQLSNIMQAPQQGQ